MQEDIKLENLLRQAYNDIINGKSLREVSKEIGIERRRLKKLIESILSEEEKQSFDNTINKKNNKIKVSNSNRDKKSRVLESEGYKEMIEKLATRGVNEEDIQQIYDRCQEKPQTKVARDTLVSKLIALLEYFDTRNKGIDEENQGYISKDDAIEMIMRNPRIINSDIKNNIMVKCQILTDKKQGNITEANKLIKSNPGVFRKTVQTIKEGR